jgi:hypothetical protein
MSLGACIPELLAQRQDPQGRRRQGERAYKRHYEALRGSMGDEAAAAEATTRALGELDYAAKLRKRQAGLRSSRSRRWTRHGRGGRQGRRARTAAWSRCCGRSRSRPSGSTNQAHEAMLGFIERHRRNLLGQAQGQDRADRRRRRAARQGHRQRHRQGVSRGGRRHVRAAAAALQPRRRRHRQRADFGLPHRHDPLKVRRRARASSARPAARARAREDGRPADRRRVHARAARRVHRGGARTFAPTAERDWRQRRARLAGARQPAQRPALLRVQGRRGVAALSPPNTATAIRSRRS